MNPEPGYKVVWPLGKTAYQPIGLKPRVSDLTNKTVCELSDYGFKSEEIFPIVREVLQKRYAGINFIEYTGFGRISGVKEDELMASLPEYLRANGADAVITGVGG